MVPCSVFYLVHFCACYGSGGVAVFFVIARGVSRLDFTTDKIDEILGK